MTNHMIVYVSDYDGAEDQVDYHIHSIVSVAQNNNAKHGITGVLFFMNNQFLQVIEGEEVRLRDLMRNIEGDDRHADVEYLVDIETEERGFPDWAMDSFNINDPSTLDREKLRWATKSFQESLAPRSDTLVRYYKILLEQANSLALPN